MKKLLLCFLVICFGGILPAQNIEFKISNFPNKKSEFKEAFSNYRKGMKYFEMGPHFFDDALDYYLKANEFNPNEAKLNYQIGVIYSMRKNEKAIKYFEKAMSLDSYYMVHGYYSIAEELHHEKKWDQAINEYNQYIKLLEETRPKIRKGERFLIDEDIKHTKVRIQQCENGKLSSDSITPIIIENLGPSVNSAYPDYAPVLNKDENLLIFTSRREGNLGKKYANNDVFPYEDIYYSIKNENGTWSEAKKIEGKINTKKHDASVWLSPDGNRLLVYRYKADGNLYEANKLENGWSKPKRIPYINSGYRETHASVTEDGKTIYFTSDNPKLTKGEMLDIFKITYDEEKKKWSKPENVGDVINTPYDESCVYISPDGKTMYFSSEGHSSIGGLDLFKSEWVDGKWSSPVNIGYPVNTTHDDIFISVSQDQTSFYMDSDRREGQGDKDIYRVVDLSSVKVPLKIIVKDASTGKEMDAEIKLIDPLNETIDLKREEVGQYESSLNSFKKYELIVNANGYQEQKFTFDTKITRPDSISITKIVNLEPAGYYVLKGHVKDIYSKSLIPAEIQIIQLDNGLSANVSGSDGNFETSLLNRKEYQIKITAEGYTPYVETLSLNSELEKDFMLSLIGVNVVLQNIYFDFDKSTLRSESIKELKNLKSIMESTPTYKVEIAGHTDNIGTANYNYSLSNRRAKAVVNWLISEGIAKNRLSHKGYGFDKPAASNDTEKGRQQNRRVEFRLIPLN